MSNETTDSDTPRRVSSTASYAVSPFIRSAAFVWAPPKERVGLVLERLTDRLHRVSHSIRWWAPKVRAALSDDLLKPEYLNSGHSHGRHEMAGHCYVASQALYHLVGGKAAGLKPMYIKHEGTSHWYLLHTDTGWVVDLTCDQFRTRVPYSKGKGKGFLTKWPDKRAAVVMTRVSGSGVPDPWCESGEARK